jgi:hypothetical protein
MGNGAGLRVSLRGDGLAEHVARWMGMTGPKLGKVVLLSSTLVLTVATNDALAGARDRGSNHQSSDPRMLEEKI